LIISACVPYPGLYYAEHTHFGLEVKANPKETKAVDINLGYDRGVFAVAPRTKRPDGDAASVLSKTDLCIKFLESSVIRNVYASGKAATIMTGSSDGTATNTPATRVKALFGVDDVNAVKNTGTSGSCE